MIASIRLRSSESSLVEGEKFKELREELDESIAECEDLRAELAKDRDVIVKLADDVDEAQRTANLLFEQKVSILDDVDRLKVEMSMQDRRILKLAHISFRSRDVEVEVEPEDAHRSVFVDPS
uniref:Uncharacterized protein n=1 Tax=Parascaris equorum TaxID=6256 RepID=A0A914S3I0_PAREQ